jgi:hypothetical protein
MQSFPEDVVPWGLDSQVLNPSWRAFQGQKVQDALPGFYEKKVAY